MTIFFTFWRISENLHRALPTVKFFQDISGSGQFFSIHFVNLFSIWFKKGACLKDASDSNFFKIFPVPVNFFAIFQSISWIWFRFDSKRALASRMHLIQVDLGVFIKFFQDISGSGQFFSIHFVNLFSIWFKKGACFKDASDSSWFGGIYKLKPTTLRVSQIHLESKILIFVTKLRPRLP